MMVILQVVADSFIIVADQRNLRCFALKYRWYTAPETLDITVLSVCTCREVFQEVQ